MNAPSRMAYVLMVELFFIEEIRLSGMLPTTKPYQDQLRNRTRKGEEIDTEFYGTSAMIEQELEEGEPRTATGAIHVFHHKL